MVSLKNICSLHSQASRKVTSALINNVRRLLCILSKIRMSDLIKELMLLWRLGGGGGRARREKFSLWSLLPEPENSFSAERPPQLHLVTYQRPHTPWLRTTTLMNMYQNLEKTAKNTGLSLLARRSDSCGQERSATCGLGSAPGTDISGPSPLECVPSS